MSFYEKHILPRFINCACGSKPIMKQREKVVPRASGVVLEIGIGTGLNLPYYHGPNVEKVIGLDPSEESWELAGERAKAADVPVEFIGLPGEEIPLDDNSVDTVLVTYSLCTIPDPVTALHGMSRVLKPGGSLLFCEHGLAPDDKVVTWQRRIEPLQKRLFDGCHLTRDIPGLIGESGFTVDRVEATYVKGPKPHSYFYLGVATNG